MFGKPPRRYLRRMPKIYGNLQRRPLSLAGFFGFFRILFWMAAGAGLVYVVWYSGWFQVRKVEVEGTQFSSAEKVKSLIPQGSNIWFFSKDRITNQILQDPLIIKATVFRGIPDSIRIVIEERRPALLWISGNQRVVLDEYGVGFAEFTRDSLPPPDSVLGQVLVSVSRVTDTKSLPISLEKGIVSPTFIHFVQEIEKDLHTYLPEMIIDHLEIADTTYGLTLVAKQGLRVQFNTLGDSGTQARNLTRLIRQNKAALNSQVDLRIDRWVYVQ